MARICIDLGDGVDQSLHMLPVLSRILEVTTPVKPTPKFKAPWPLVRGVTLMAFQLTDSQQVDLSVQFTDKKGNPAKVDGVPTWLVDNPNLLALTPSVDGKTCTVAAVGPLGSAVVSMKADADLGAGVTDLVGSFDVDITGGTATNVVITPGTPTEQP